MIFRRKKSLSAGTRVDQYIIEGPLGGGGFSLVYLAKRVLDQRPVVIKEYMPQKMARRARDLKVEVADQSRVDFFNRGRRLFFQEAKTLATLRHPNIVEVLTFFPANGTAYMVMNYERGKNLGDYIKSHRKGLSERFLLTVFCPLLSGLRLVHSQALLHLDIKPGNIHLRPGGNPLLLDFGAVYSCTKSRREQPGRVLSAGFSPIELYHSRGYVGPWSDIYAIGATMRACIEGHPPPAATARYDQDRMRPAGCAFKHRYSANLLQILDWTMEVDPLLRPQSIDELLDALGTSHLNHPAMGGS